VLEVIDRIKQNLLNARGWTTNRKIVVIESDDWGSIRMPNKKVLASLTKLIPSIAQSPYCQFDSIASSEDLDALFSVLHSIKDKYGNSPIFTANTVVANPDFGKIRSNLFEQYYFESFTETLNSYYPNDDVFTTWQNGIDSGVFFPQFHGREHVNTLNWMKGLRENEKLLSAFDLGCWGIPKEVYFTEVGVNLQATYDAKSIEEIILHKDSLITGLKMFEEIFKYRSKSFIPNNFIFDKNSLSDVLIDNGVSILQGMKYHKNPRYHNKQNPLDRRILGKRGSNFVELVRNVNFEPSQELLSTDVVGRALSEVATAFFWNKPAIITTHRLNFIGGLSMDNRKRNLKSLQNLLSRILLKWPSTMFLNSVQLAEFIENDNSNNKVGI
jgi:hypothetical protein